MLLIAAAALFAVSLLAVLPAPHGLLWKPKIAATELGHWLVLLALLLLLPGWRGGPRVAWTFGLAAVAALLLASPLLRALAVAGRVDASLRAGLAELGDATPRTADGAPARSAPLRLLGLFAGPAAPEVTVQTLTYDAGRGLALDLYLRPGVAEPRPIVVAIHGGSWSGGEREQLPAINHYLAARGYAVAAITYRLAPAHPYPAAFEDVVAAMRALRGMAAEHGLDPDRIVLLGRSAGGHLALLAGYRSELPVRGVVAYYPPTDLHWSWANPTHPWLLDTPGCLSAFLGGTPETHGEAYTSASPMAHVRADSPPTLLIHGDRDQLVFRRQSARLAEALATAGVACVDLRLPWATHGCDAFLSSPSGQLSTYAIERFVAAVTR